MISWFPPINVEKFPAFFHAYISLKACQWESTTALIFIFLLFEDTLVVLSWLMRVSQIIFWVNLKKYRFNS